MNRNDQNGSVLPGGQCRPIVAVDDDAVTRRVVRAMLERNGFTVQAVSTAEEALQLLSRTVPSLLILDVTLPGISGYELCRALKKDARLNHVPIVFLTGQRQPQHYKEGHDAGGTMYVTKPVKEEHLLMVTRILLPLQACGANTNGWN